MPLLDLVTPKHSYISLFGVKGTQFNHNVISIQCTANDVLKFLEIDRDVQRELDTLKVASIGQYIHGGLEGNSIYFSPLIFSARGQGEYNEEKHEYRLKMDDELFVLDGQHRIKAFDYLKKRFESHGEKELLAKLVNFPLTIQVYTSLSFNQERQLFTDINTNASPVNNSLLIMYKTDDPYGNLVKEVIGDLPEDTIETRLKTTRSKLMTVSMLYKTAKLLNYGIYYKVAKSLSPEQYGTAKKRTVEFIECLRTELEFDSYDRSKWIVLNSFVLLGIAKHIYDVVEKYPELTIKEAFCLVVPTIDWSHSNRDFMKLSIVRFNKKLKRYEFTNSVNRGIEDFSEFLNRRVKKKEVMERVNR